MSNNTSTDKKTDDTSDTGGACACTAKKCCCPGELTLAFWVLRLWLGVRALLTGIQKFSASRVESVEDIDTGAIISKTVLSYDFTAPHGLPPALAKRLADQPLIPGWGLSVFDYALGPALILLGVALLLGIGTRASLFLQGVLYSLLTLGLILLNEDGGIAWLGIHILLIVAALALVKHNKLTVYDKF